MFVSSTSSIANYSGCYPNATFIPEESLTSTDYAVALPIGYRESKHVAERMLAVAAERSGVKVDILRLGQVAGPIAPHGGCWNRNEWFPSLIQTSKALGYLPDKLREVDWIPADVLVRIIRDLAHQGIQTYNLINPHSRDWKTLVPFVQRMIGGEAVPLKEWIVRSRAVDADDKAEVAGKPALKILDCFGGVEAGLSAGKEGFKRATANGRGASETMRELGPVSEEWMGHWLGELGL